NRLLGLDDPLKLLSAAVVRQRGAKRFKSIDELLPVEFAQNDIVDIDGVGDSLCLLMESGDVAGCQIRRRGANEQRRPVHSKFGAYRLAERTRCPNEVSLETCSLPSKRTKNNKRRDNHRWNNTSNDETIEPKTNRTAGRNLCVRRVHASESPNSRIS